MEVIRQMLMGYASIFLAPANLMPRPSRRITLPPRSLTQGIAYDFYRISNDLNRAISKVEHEKQLELILKPRSEHESAKSN
jgi:hypothetical protein